MNSTHFIYTHTSPSGKVYVGQTVNIKKRWGYNGEHYKTKKLDGSYIQPSFAKALDKYGWDNFKHEILLEGIPKSEADYTEKYLIKWYKLHGLSYNCTDGGEGTCGIHQKLSQERKDAISERMRNNHPMKGKHHTPEAMAKIITANQNRIYSPEQKAAMAERARLHNTGRAHSEESKKKMSDYRKSHPETWIGGWNKKEVHQYDLNGDYIASYPSAMDAAKAIGKNVCGNISKCAKEGIISAGGYIWKPEKIEHLDMSEYRIVKTSKGARLYDMSEKGKKKRRDGHGKKVNQYSLDGKYITTFTSITDAMESLNYKGGGISKCCLHLPKYESAAGYLWEYDTITNRVDKEKQINKSTTKKS